MKTVLITGANRGIGLALAEAVVARGDRVIATARRPEEAQQLNALASLTGKIEIEPLDVVDPASLAALTARMEGRSIDLLVANAGVFEARGGLDDPSQSLAGWRDTLLTNVYGPFATVQALHGALLRPPVGKVAIISSKMGSSARAPGGSYAYRASKAAATNLACNLAAALKDDGVAVGAYHPGWVRTDMGGAAADIAVHESAGGLLARFDALDLAHTGMFEGYDGEAIAF